MEKILSLEKQICKFFFERCLDFLTSVPQRRTQEIILASYAKGNSGKLTNYAEIFPTHRTTYGHFLPKGKWSDEKMAQTQQCESFQAISELAASEREPVSISIDDTVITKTWPSSKANRPTEGTGWHYSLPVWLQNPIRQAVIFQLLDIKWQDGPVDRPAISFFPFQ